MIHSKIYGSGRMVDIFIVFTHTYNLFQANDVTREGVFKHHTDGTDVTWFSPKWNCWGGMQYYGSQGGDAIKLGIAYNFRMNGAWCDAHGYKEENYFICERSKE